MNDVIFMVFAGVALFMSGGIGKTAAEGNPIPQNVQDHVYQIINDRFEELAEQEQQQADAQNEAPLEEMAS